MSWDCMKLLCSLRFSNSTIDETKTLFICCDSSQIGLGIFCWQLSDEGEMILIWCDSKILKQADRNKSSSFRELLGILWGITALEGEIRSHGADVVILSDCTSLSLLIRQKFHNIRLLEISIFLGSFTNISVQ